MRTIAAVLAFLVLIPAAYGESFVSNKYGFSAEFPSQPSVGIPQGSETDASGKFVSQSVNIMAESQGVYTAMVTVDSYTVPVKIDASPTLTAMVRSFVAQLDAVATSSKPGKLEGRPARFFTYATADRSIAGSGIVVLVPSKKPRIYMIVTMHTPLASDGQIAALDKFLKSFQFE